MSVLADRYERIPHALHESPRIAGCVCNTCLRLEVLAKRKHGGDVEKYWCTRMHHGYFDPRKVKECDVALYDTDGICKAPSRHIKVSP